MGKKGEDAGAGAGVDHGIARANHFLHCGTDDRDSASIIDHDPVGTDRKSVEGIGIELLIKLWKNKKNNNFILFSNKEILNNFFKKNNIKIKLKIVNHYLNKKKIKKIDFNNCLNIFDFSAKNLLLSLSNLPIIPKSIGTI